MRILTGGHRYELENLENKSDDGQILQFIEKVNVEEFAKTGLPFPYPAPQEGYSNTKLFTVRDGTTNEEVLTVLIDRMQFLQSKFPCHENAIVITKLEESLMWLQKRTRDRLERGVEGKHIA